MPHHRASNNNTKVNHVWQASNLFTNGFPNGHTTSGPECFVQGRVGFAFPASSRPPEIPHCISKMSYHIKVFEGVQVGRSGVVLPPCLARVRRTSSELPDGGSALSSGATLKESHTTPPQHWDALFCLATLQVFALLLRPNKNNKYRVYWNIYHHATGYSVIILSVVNIFKGFDILQPIANGSTLTSPLFRFLEASQLFSKS
ncbi:hypothetical protein KSP40_PGU020616 [Platanthera guangdongensis]|uniref:Cytochrome b561 domain-containing protein n=1 Tax=Platanthera guangdongensis TaxID=2320717 RepID=A0ABR2M5C6_9ASPA